MQTFEKTMQTPFSQNQMYNLVADVASYPAFLPWCSKVDILESKGNCKRVRIELQHLQLPPLSLTTQATFSPDSSLSLKQISGSFLAVFEGRWQFIAHSSNSPQCTVIFTVKYRFSNILLKLTLAPFFSLMMSMLPELFLQQAEKMYSGNS